MYTCMCIHGRDRIFVPVSHMQHEAAGEFTRTRGLPWRTDLGEPLVHLPGFAHEEPSAPPAAGWQKDQGRPGHPEFHALYPDNRKRTLQDV